MVLMLVCSKWLEELRLCLNASCTVLSESGSLKVGTDSSLPLTTSWTLGVASCGSERYGNLLFSAVLLVAESGIVESCRDVVSPVVSISARSRLGCNHEIVSSSDL